MGELSSRERMLGALDLKPGPIPCCFMSFTALRRRHGDDWFEVVKAERAMGLDAMLFIPATPRAQRPEYPDLRGLPLRFDPRVNSREWSEAHQDGIVLYREYVTPVGRLSTAVRPSQDWPHGQHIPFVDDFQVPRTLKPLIASPGDLAPLQYLLTPPTDADTCQFHEEAARAVAFVREQGVLLAGGWGIGLDMANWLCGMQNLMLMTMDDPAFVVELLEMIHQWNIRRMSVVLSAPVDLYIRRAWYEGCDFVTPQFYRQAVLPRLKREVELAHEHGARFGYICSSGIGPMLDDYLQAGIDVLIGIDPIQGRHTDMAQLKAKLGHRVCLWGGISGAITVERGTEQEVRAAVRQAIGTLGPIGLILSPVDNITVDVPRTWHNIATLIDEWQANAAPSL